MKLPVVTSPALDALPGIAHAFFTREGGVSAAPYGSLNGGLGSSDDREAVLENRRRMAAHLGAGLESLAFCYQHHSADCMVIDAAWPQGKGPRADAVATATPGVVAAVTIADCGPILFADAEARVVAAAHAGWKGAFTGVLESTLAAMESLGAARGRVTAALGACIRQPSYEVGPEFVARFTDADPANARFFVPSGKPGHALFDLGGYIVARLEAAGVGAVEDLALDTYGDERRFFSYRRMTHRGESDYGRLVAGIMLAP